MKAIIKLSDYPNLWGSAASGLCLAHCVATLFLFLAHTGHVQGHHSHPFWWGIINLLFIAIHIICCRILVRKKNFKILDEICTMGFLGIS